MENENKHQYITGSFSERNYNAGSGVAGLQL